MSIIGSIEALLPSGYLHGRTRWLSPKPKQTATATSGNGSHLPHLAATSPPPRNATAIRWQQDPSVLGKISELQIERHVSLYFQFILHTALIAFTPPPSSQKPPALVRSPALPQLVSLLPAQPISAELNSSPHRRDDDSQDQSRYLRLLSIAPVLFELRRLESARNIAVVRGARKIMRRQAWKGNGS